ncbi:MAG: NADPH-dependent reductase domain protein [Parcubacteria group bacterium]|nr:NADPH-dependent reductase domain protein [Parcubacteria group bacterium]
MPNYRLLAISGSLRKESINTSLVKGFIANAPEGTTIEMLDWADTPIFNQDDEASFPAYVTALKDKIRAADGVIIATPEYNRSIPGPLKNVLDWTSRPYGDSAWAGKPVYISGATGGSVGTALAQDDVKKFMGFNAAMVMSQPEFYMTGAPGKFDESGTLTNEDTKKHIVSGLTAFAAFIEKLQ